MTATEQFIGVLSDLKSGELGLLRQHAGQGLDETVDGIAVRLNFSSHLVT
jgi:hypothetical protein